MIDYGIKKNIDALKNIDSMKFKRSFFAYLFHDYNKIIEDRDMENCNKNINYIIESSPNLKNMAEELGFSVGDLCFITKATENRTTDLLYSENSIGQPALDFESNFSTLADSISSTYAKGEEVHNLKFGGVTIIKNEDIKKVKIQSTHLFALTGSARNSIKYYIEDRLDNKGEATFLWDTTDTLFYVGRDLSQQDFNEIKKIFKETIMKKISISKTTVMDDRRVLINASRIFKLEEKDFEDYLSDENNFVKNVLHLNGVDLDSEIMEELQKYIEEVNKLNINCFIITIPKSKNLRAAIIKNNFSDIECKMKVFLTRFIQINGKDMISSSNDYLETNKILTQLKNYYEDYRKKYKIFDLDNGVKSSLLVPLVVSNDQINFETVKNEILRYLDNGRYLQDTDFNEIFDKIILSKPTPLEDMPHKKEMSIITGSKGDIKADISTLYGVNHQTFTNRIITAKNLNSGKIDKVSVLENILRMSILPLANRDEDSIILFSRLTGPIPIFNLYEVLKNLNRVEWVKIKENDPAEDIIIGDLEIPPQVDNSIVVVLGNMNSDEKSIAVFKKVLNYAKITGFQCLVTYANSPVIEGQLEIIRFEVNNSLLSAMKYNVLRYSELNEIEKEFGLIQNITVSLYGYKKLNNNIANVLRSFVNEPLSIFQYIEKIPLDKNIFSETTGKENYQNLIKLLEKRGVKMNNLENLAEKAAEIKKINSKDSTNEKTWLLREPLEALEKLQAETRMPKAEKRPLKDFQEFVSGIIMSYLERDEDQRKYLKIDKIENFTDSLIKLLDQDFNGKIPTGNLKSYIISAFAFLYLKKSQEAYLNKGGS
ncbi:MAG: hypothetical protein QXH07_02655 [Thermoplasmata archaeon]